MAVLTEDERTKIRQAVAIKAVEIGVPVSWVKAEVQDAAQAVEDVLASASFQSAINTAIENAAPGLFTAQQKRWLAALVFELRFSRDIIG